MSRPAAEPARELDAGDILAYLRRHPEFLGEHPEAMRLLRPPARDSCSDFKAFRQGAPSSC